jgi:eukaryotic-like serine/threonine-protein kinase
MLAPQTTDALLDLCRKSGVVETSLLDQFINKYPLPLDPIKAADVLMERGFLTKFQATQILRGKYRGFILNGLKILEELGAGGMGAVYLCEQIVLKRRVAVKVLPLKAAQEQVSRERFFREARAVAALDHPNIVRIHDCSVSDKVYYLVMEYLEGIDLQAKLKRDGKFPISEAIDYILHAAAGLHHIHKRGLVHRDVKPSNLFLDKKGVIKILDMGLARFFLDPTDNLTQRLDKGAVVGTVDFIAPEQAIQNASVDARADIYSLGATLYTLVTGKLPYEGSTSEKLRSLQIKPPPALIDELPNIDPQLSEVVRKMMSKNISERFQSTTQVVRALNPWAKTPIRVKPKSLPSTDPSVRDTIKDRQTLPEPLRMPPPLPRPPGRWKWVMLGVLLAILAGIIFI